MVFVGIERFLRRAEGCSRGARGVASKWHFRFISGSFTVYYDIQDGQPADTDDEIARLQKFSMAIVSERNVMCDFCAQFSSGRLGPGLKIFIFSHYFPLISQPYMLWHIRRREGTIKKERRCRRCRISQTSKIYSSFCCLSGTSFEKRWRGCDQGNVPVFVPKLK